MQLSMNKSSLWNIFFVLSLGFVFLLFYWKLSTPKSLIFSDGAKMADIARNVVEGRGYGGSFSSFGADKKILEHLDRIPFPRYDRQPLMPLSIAVFFSIFGVGDVSIIFTSAFFYLLSLVFIFLLGERIFSRWVGFLGAVAFLSFPDFWPYALGGASETVFLLQIVLTFYLFSFGTKKTAVAALFVAALSYFTRPQGFILIAGSVLYYLLTYEKTRKQALLKFLIVAVAAALIDLAILSNITGKTFFYSVLSKGADVSVLYTEKLPGTTGLRTGVDTKSELLKNITGVGKKVFYNLYNLYKLQPGILNPYLWALFVIGIFIKSEKSGVRNFKTATLFMIIVGFVSTSVSIPFFRYIHPFIALIYLIAVDTLLQIEKKLMSGRGYLTGFLILFFAVGIALGNIFLDSRFLSARVNGGKSTIYKQMSEILAAKTEKESLTLTNLDTWGSWYGDRRTVWFTTEPHGVVIGDDIPFDYIYLTSYLMDDENYYMNSSWRSIFENPTDKSKWDCEGCGVFSEKFELEGVYTFPANGNYERINGNAVLLKKNSE